MHIVVVKNYLKMYFTKTTLAILKNLLIFAIAIFIIKIATVLQGVNSC